MATYNTLSRYRVNASKRTADRATSVPLTAPYTVYAIKEGDTIENIAARQLGDPKRYWEIADLNPQVKFPSDLTPGLSIRLPA